ncbi:hypothetical protein BABINDRAFT_163176 [Babjeviella inositovora NRRL Y-12698]|uniref:Uncharacterized protein n=1 Tax=Babjeviella inositovora NRRL Y-12698 TaxID=984486 RepID=A0A1E3QJ91_9ASCO|nr:uncharacterized protein BABINDRAFT_163176 [Babjeviella inositovora NRRL Y-12698]ODQ77783.1 hypothetical protein BABINDRAFT_163176 [Babjeviella inositovora NRRL Y-12698]
MNDIKVSGTPDVNSVKYPNFLLSSDGQLIPTPGLGSKNSGSVPVDVETQQADRIALFILRMVRVTGFSEDTSVYIL